MHISNVPITTVESLQNVSLKLQPHKRFFSFLVTVTITSDRAANLDLCLACVTGQQGMPTPPWYLILPLHLSEVHVALNSIL
jgi:hypothetical protein